jgi:prepilin-type N-terminal cleavage/methylation domain-containing protein
MLVLKASHWRRFGGFTIIELIVALGITAILLSLGTISIMSLLQKENLAKGTDMMKQDILAMRSRAVSVLKVHRLIFESDRTYRVQECDDIDCASPEDITELRHLPSDIRIRNFDLTNKPKHLQFKTNGLPEFNGASASPFVTLYNATTDARKGITVQTGGAVSIGDGEDDVI